MHWKVPVRLFMEQKGDPIWCGIDERTGEIKIGLNNEPEAVAHELAHGLYETMRKEGCKEGRTDSINLGEQFCNAFRYYVECRMHTDSDWLKNFKKGENTFTQDLATFDELFNEFEIVQGIRKIYVRFQ